MKHFDPSTVAQSTPLVRRLANWELHRTRAIVAAQAPSRFLSQHIAPLVHRDTVARPGEDLFFDDEIDFWRASSGLSLSTVCLSRFRISDWFPRAPGVYWSQMGQRSRNMVYDHGPENDAELGPFYAPISKMELVEQGGLGNVRLTPKRIDGVRCWLGMGCTGLQGAGGVPLAIPDILLRSSDVTWGDTVQLTGEVRYLKELGLEDVAAAVHHAAPIIVFVQEIKCVAERDRRDEPLILTPVVLFSANDTPRLLHTLGGDKRAYGYSFVPCVSAPTELDGAAEWMSLYAAKYSGTVITNFDETSPTLADAPLSYQRLVARDHDRTYIESLTLHGTLDSYIDKIGNMTNINNVTLGNGVVVNGPLTVANSVKDSFNRGEAVTSPDLRELLTKLSSQVGEILQRMPAESAEKAADDLAMLTKELSRPAPRRQWWELSVDGIKEAATAMGEIGAPIIKTVAELLPLLTGK